MQKPLQEQPHHPLNIKRAEQLLRQYFGYASFRPGQREIIEAVLNGRDCLAVMPTGAGKSLCYQIPALMFQGVTIVISPLISLMKDQVSGLIQLGIAAAYLNSSLDEKQIGQVLANLEKGTYRILYVAPERLNTPRFLASIKKITVSLLAIDEAHCISQWGHDFRFSYKEIGHFAKKLSKRPPISAFTATATLQVREDIQASLKLKDPFIMTAGFDRSNLFFRTAFIADKKAAVLSYVRQHKQESGIIYCSTRRMTEEIALLLNENGINCGCYHAGMEAAERNRQQDDFLYEKVMVIAATNAFGMGIDKSNVRYVLHAAMPSCLENYYQEAGRAGRDGLPAECVLFYNGKDIVTQRFLLQQKEWSKEISDTMIEQLKKQDEKRLQAMIDYTDTAGCLRSQILYYFENISYPPCGFCGNCLSGSELKEMKAEAQKVINCVWEMQEGYGAGVILDILQGKKTARIRRMHWEKKKMYGALSQLDSLTLRRLLEKMLEEELLLKTDDAYPLIKLGRHWQKLQNEKYQLLIKIEKPKAIKEKRRGGYKMEESELFEALRKLRFTIAKQQSVPPYIVFSDRTLLEMCRKRPQNKNELKAVSGIGKVKMQKYGAQFLAVLKEYGN